MSSSLAQIPTSREQCLALDAADPLALFRAEYTLFTNGVYLDGNSLGVLPVRTPRSSAGRSRRSGART